MMILLGFYRVAVACTRWLRRAGSLLRRAFTLSGGDMRHAYGGVRAGRLAAGKRLCPHSNIEMMLSPRREHHLQLTKITTIGNCVLVCTRTLILKHMLLWMQEHHSRGRLFSTCWSSWGACNSAIESRCESKHHW